MVRLTLLALFIVPSFARAADDEDVSRSITLRCAYADYDTFESETVTIEATRTRSVQPASTRTFARKTRHENTAFDVKPGERAECVFPSRNRVRVKVGETTARPYGMCGADPQVFASIWINERKIASRVWFTGHCRELNEQPRVSFRIAGPRVSIEKCHTPLSAATNEDPLSVCVDYPAIERFERDALEYPRGRTKKPAVGDIELLAGAGKVCEAARRELKADFGTFGNYPNERTVTLRRPAWAASTAGLPDVLAGAADSVFDFDNDGKPDRVFHRAYESGYMDATVLLVQSDISKRREASPAIDPSATLLPCQIGRPRFEIRDCPPFSQKGDDAGFGMKGRSGETVFFRARYATVAPFSFEGATFIGVSSRSEDTGDYVAVLKPLANGKFASTCLFRRVSENF